MSALANPVFAVKILFNFGLSSSALRAQSAGDFDVLCGLPATHPGVVYVYTTFVDAIPAGARFYTARCARQPPCVSERVPVSFLFRATEIMRALPEDVAKTVIDGAAGGRASARFIIMAAHEMSLERWLQDNRDATDFAGLSRLCERFGEVRADHSGFCCCCTVYCYAGTVAVCVGGAVSRAASGAAP
jgi:hypothetical protein